MATQEWWLDYGNIITLILWLADTDQIEDTAKGACEVLEKPWHWEAEWYAMHAQESAEARRAIDALDHARQLDLPESLERR